MDILSDQQRAQSHQQEIFEFYRRESGLPAASTDDRQPARSLVRRLLGALAVPNPHISKINLIDLSDWDEY